MDIQEQISLIQAHNAQNEATKARIRANNNGQPVPERKGDGVHSRYDNRTGAYCPPFDENDNTPDGLAKKEAADKFIREYILDGSAALRKPYLDSIVDDLITNAPTMLPSASPSQAVQSAKTAKDPGISFKFKYLENLFTDNPDYFNNLEPQKMERLNAMMSYETPYESVNNTMQKSLNINSKNLGVPLVPGFIAENERELPRRESTLEAAVVMYKTRVNMLDGIAVAKPVIDFNFMFTPPTEASALFDMKNIPRPLEWNMPGVSHFSLVYSNRMDGIFDPDQQKTLKALGFHKYDMVYINGVSATEKYNALYPPGTPGRDYLIEAEIVSAMINDKARIDVTPVMMNQNGNYQMVPMTIKASVREIQPRVGFFSTSEDKKLQNAFAKNATDKNINKTFEASLTAKRVEMLKKFEELGSTLTDEAGANYRETKQAEALQKAIQKNEWEANKQFAWPIQAVRDKPDGDLESAMEVDLDELEEELKLDDELTKAKDNPTQHLQNSKKVVTGLANDRYELGKALFGDDYIDENKSGNGGPQFYNGQIRSTRSGMSIAAAMLYVDGHSFEDILNPERLLEEKQAAGQKIRDWVNDANSKDLEKSGNAVRQAIKLYNDFYDKYSKAPPLGIDHTNETAVADNYRSVHGMGFIAFDIGQEIQHLGKEAMKDLGYVEPKTTEKLNAEGKKVTEVEELSDEVKANNKRLEAIQREKEVVLKFSSRPYSVFEKSLSTYSVLQSDQAPQMGKITTVLTNTHLSKEGAALLNNATKMSDIKSDFDAKATAASQMAGDVGFQMLQRDKVVFMRGVSAMINKRDVMNVSVSDVSVDVKVDLGKNKPSASMGSNGHVSKPVTKKK